MIYLAENQELKGIQMTFFSIPTVKNLVRFYKKAVRSKSEKGLMSKCQEAPGSTQTQIKCQISSEL